MPYEVNLTSTGNPNASIGDRLQETNSSQALNILKGLSAHVKDKDGVLSLQRTDDPLRPVRFERKSWYQFWSRRAAPMEQTAQTLRVLFTKALDQTKFLPEQKEHFLLLLDSYLQERGNKFGTKSLGVFVDMLKQAEDSVTVLNESTVRLDPGKVKRLPANRLLDLGGKELTEFLDPLKEDAEELGSGGQGAAYRIEGNRVLKIESRVRFHKIAPDSKETKTSAFPYSRKGDLGICRLKQEANIVKPEVLYLAVQNLDDIRNERPYSEIWEVPAAKVKGFLKQVARREGKQWVGLIGQIMPLAKGEPLDKIYRAKQPLPIDGDLRHIARGLCQALSTLDKARIVHHDIKPANLIYDRRTGKVSVIDSGIAVKLSKKRENLSKSTNEAGSTGFKSPQVLQGKPHGPEVDFYSSACTLLTLAEPDFLTALQQFNDTIAVINNKDFDLAQHKPSEYLAIMLRHGENSDVPRVRQGTKRLKEKLQKFPEFREFISLLFVVSAGLDVEGADNAEAARKKIAESPYLKGK